MVGINRCGLEQPATLVDCFTAVDRCGCFYLMGGNMHAGAGQRNDECKVQNSKRTRAGGHDGATEMFDCHRLPDHCHHLPPTAMTCHALPVLNEESSGAGTRLRSTRCKMSRPEISGGVQVSAPVVGAGQSARGDASIRKMRLGTLWGLTPSATSRGGETWQLTK